MIGDIGNLKSCGKYFVAGFDHQQKLGPITRSAYFVNNAPDSIIGPRQTGFKQYECDHVGAKRSLDAFKSRLL